MSEKAFKIFWVGVTKKEWSCLSVPTMFRKCKSNDDLVLLYTLVFNSFRMKESIKQQHCITFKWATFRKYYVKAGGSRHYVSCVD